MARPLIAATNGLVATQAARPPAGRNPRIPIAATHALGLTLAAGCFHAPAYSPQRSVATWHDMQSTRPGSNTPAGSRDTPSPAADDALSADQAYALALANNPELAVAEAEAEVAAAGVDVAKQVENPTVRFTNFRVDDTAGGKTGFNLGLRAPIPRPGSVHARVKQARLAADSVHSETEAARRLLRSEIDRRYARLALLRADIDELTRAAALGDARRTQLRARLERQAATQVDLALADVDHAETLEQASRARDELALTEAELTRLIGPGPPRTFRVDANTLGARDLPLDMTRLTEQALRARPELRTAQSRVSQAQAGVYLARSEVYPWLSWAQVNYYFGASSTPAAFGFGLALDVPLFSWNRGEIKAARALVRQREAEERASVSQVASEVRDALARVERANTRVQELEATLLPRLDEAARAAEAALAAGALDPLQAGEIEARRVAARRLHLAALHDRRDALIDLELALGGPLTH
ncbi:TolC family protein [Nannocystis sp.]|uniref:TolC family protein n=1 Tax=Nannocystis sp. TaxID=1962667 RepID=UPI0025DF9AAD|nr:TolC family protein [Nannocystis sp.]MBK7827939.1 TolC family protein [Nannocystis sp.]